MALPYSSRYCNTCRRTRTQYSAALATEDWCLDDDDDPVTVELGHRDASSVAAKEEWGHGCTQSYPAALVAEEGGRHRTCHGTATLVPKEGLRRHSRHGTATLVAKEGGRCRTRYGTIQEIHQT